MREIEQTRREVDDTAAKQVAEIAELRARLQKERFDRREQINTMRHDAELLVKQKSDAVLGGITAMKGKQHVDDSDQQDALDELAENCDTLKQALLGINSAWHRVIQSINRERGDD